MILFTWVKKIMPLIYYAKLPRGSGVKTYAP